MVASFNVNYFPPLQMQPTTIKPNELRQSLCCSIRISSVSFGLSPQNQDEVARKPKLFFLSTSSTTTTLQTASICCATSGAPTGTCTGRKKRSINIDSQNDQNEVFLLFFLHQQRKLLFAHYDCPNIVNFRCDAGEEVMIHH